MKMKAVGLYRYLPITENDSLVDLEIEKPTPFGHDLLVKVEAVSVNPVDTKVRSPKDMIENTPKILGWDVAGTVVEAGPDCTLFQPGDTVYYAGSIIRSGGNSEFHLIDERIVGKKPTTLDFAEAAALPLTAITAWEALFDRMGISKTASENEHKSILIIGAAGGVGSIATQLSKWIGLTVIGTASRPESIEWAKKHGADYTINHHQAFAAQLHELGINAVDYIFCLNNTEMHWNNMAEVVAPQGKICSIVETEQTLDLAPLKNKSVTFVWEFMFTRAMYQTSDMIEQHNLLNQLAELIDTGIIKTTLTERLKPINAANLRLAHAKIEQGNTIGKIVVEGFSNHHHQ